MEARRRTARGGIRERREVRGRYLAGTGRRHVGATRRLGARLHVKGMAKGGVEHEDGSENGTVLRPGASEAMDDSRRAEAVTWLRRGDNGSARRAEHEQWKHGDALRAEA